MSIEAVTLGAARVAKLAPSVKGAYALAGDSAHGILPFPKDVPDAPIVTLRHERFELNPGSWQTIVHFIALDLYLRATEPHTAEKQTSTVVDELLAAYRGHTSLFGALDAPGAAGYAVIVSGGPALDVTVNNQPLIVYPLTVRAVQATPEAYTGGPSS